MSEGARTRIVIADDHILLAQACKGLLEPEFEVVAIVNNGRALVKMAQELRPDVIIVDVAMPQLNGLDAGEQVKRLLPETKLVFLTMSLDPEVAAEAFRRGASGYVVKNSAFEELLIAIRTGLSGQSYLSPTVTQDTLNFLLRVPQSETAETRISPRQLEVLKLLAEGRSMKEIAMFLQLKPGTVAFHKYRIMKRLGLTTNAELLHYAIKRHII